MQGLLQSRSFKSFAIAIGTILSRITGLLKATVIVSVLGFSSFTDGYNVANIIPNLLFILMIGGVFNSVFIPRLVQAYKDKYQGDIYANNLLILSAIILLLISAIFVYFAPEIVHLYTHFKKREYYNITIIWARWCLPQIFFYGIYALVSQICNIYKSYILPMWAPILNNIIVILTFIIIRLNLSINHLALSNNIIHIIGFGTTLGVFVQMLSLVILLYYLGFRIRINGFLSLNELKEIYKLGYWTVLFVLTNQLTLIVIMKLSTYAGSTLGNPGYTVYSNAQMIIMSVQSIIGTSLMTVTYPHISKLAIDKKNSILSIKFQNLLSLLGILIIPIVLYLFVFSKYISTYLFQYGVSTAHDINWVSLTLQGFALSLLPYTLQYCFLRIFYIFHNTKMSFFVNLPIAISNILFAYLCYFILSSNKIIIGMSYVYAISYFIGIAFTIYIIKKKYFTIFTSKLLNIYAIALIYSFIFILLIKYIVSMLNIDYYLLHGYRVYTVVLFIILSLLYCIIYIFAIYKSKYINIKNIIKVIES